MADVQTPPASIAQSAANQAQIAQAAQNAEKPKQAGSMQELLDQIVAGIGKFAMEFGPKMVGLGGAPKNLLSTGVAANLNIENAAMIKAGESINKGAQSFTFAGGKLAEIGSVAGGGGLANLAAGAGISGLPIEAQSQVNSIRDMQGEGMPVVAMSNENLGNIMPMDTPGMMRSQGMSMGMA